MIRLLSVRLNIRHGEIDMGEIIAFLVYTLLGICLANIVIGNSGHKMDEFEELVAIVVLATFWPIALVALMVIVLDNWFNGR